MVSLCPATRYLHTLRSSHTRAVFKAFFGFMTAFYPAKIRCLNTLTPGTRRQTISRAVRMRLDVAGSSVKFAFSDQVKFWRNILCLTTSIYLLPR